MDLNAAQAALRAGYKNLEIGRQLITKNNVSSAIQEAKRARSERTEITQDYVLAKLKEITDKPASDASDSDLKYSSKIKALELLGKHVGAFDGKANGDGDTEVKVVIDV